MIKKHLASYRFAMKGIILAFREEVNMSFHLVATVAVVAANYALDVTRTEWLITIILIGVVWMAEMFNTAIEKLADRVNPERDPVIGQVKDLAAGAVLLICVAAVICGVVIYGRYLF